MDSRAADASNARLWDRALGAWQAGNAAEAEALLAQLLVLAPRRAQVWHLAGVVATAAAQESTALARLERAAELAPGNENISLDLSRLLYKAGRFAEAAAIAVQALTHSPRSVALWFLLGAAKARLGDEAAAVAAYGRALEIDPAHVDSRVNLAMLAQQQGRFDAALALYGEVLEQQPAHAAALNNSGAALIALHRFDQAVPLLQRLLAHHPDDVPATANLGQAMTSLPEFDAGVALLRTAAAKSGNSIYALRADLAIPPLLASRDEILDFRAGFERRLDRWIDSPVRIADPLKAMARTGFYLAYQGLDDRVLQEKTARLYMRASPGLATTAPGLRDAALPGDRRIRVGFVSMFLREHTIGKLFRGLIGELDREEFECVVFTPPAPDDSVLEYFRQQGVTVIPLPATLEQARQVIGEQRPDILFYPDIGMDPFTYLLAFSRLAPVQFASWGHPVTTGIPAIDFFLSHDHCECGDTAAQYTEQLVRLPAAVAYTRYLRPAYVGERKTRADFGLPEDRTLYLLPHSFYKLHPDFVAALNDLLQADGRATLVFVGAVQPPWIEVVRQRLAPRGNAENIRFAGWVSPGDFIELLRLGDVLLDTFHFGGGNTTAEAIGTGIPVVTLPGAMMRGRFTYAWLKHLGLDEGIAASAEDFVAVALRLGGDPELRHEVRARTLTAAKRLHAETDCVREFASVLRRSLSGGW